MDNAVKKIKIGCSPSVEEEEPSPPTISWLYNPFVKIYVQPLLHSYDCKLVNRTSSTIRSRLVNTKPPKYDDISVISGVYNVPCKSCEKNYVGKTGCEFSVR